MISDTHVHTSFSTDCGTPPEEVVRQAVKLGMRDLCITDHYDPDFDIGGWVFDPDEYFGILLPLKEKYRDIINIHIGIEMGLQPHLCPRFEKLRADYPFEYAIGSVHVLLGKDPFYREEYDMTDAAYFREYFKFTAECLKACAGLYDTVGHLDYVVRYAYGGAAEYSFERYAEWIDSILETAVQSGAALEINTGGLRKGAGMIHPAGGVIGKYIEKGGTKFTVGSDAHHAKDVGGGFDAAERCLREYGVRCAEGEGGIFLYRDRGLVSNFTNEG